MTEPIPETRTAGLMKQASRHLARLEADSHADDITGRIASISQNARTTWFGLLALLAFVGVALLAHNDADFFAFGVETELPLIGISVPVWGFFFTAPVLVAALYIYLHVYLFALWDALGAAPGEIDGKPLSEKVYPWLLSRAALWLRGRFREDGSSAPHAMGGLVLLLSFAITWSAGLFALAAFWIRSMPAHDPWLTLWIGGWLALSFYVGAQGGETMRRAMHAREVRLHPHETPIWIELARVPCAVFVIFWSWQTTHGGVPWGDRQPTPFLISASLEEAELTVKPADWTSWENWNEDFRAKWRRDAEGDFGEHWTSARGFEGGKLTPDQRAAYITARDERIVQEAAQRYAEYIASLEAPSLIARDLRGALATGAFMPGVDLRQADLRAADLGRADLKGANLGRADLKGADLGHADLQGANLRRADLQGADLWEADLQGAKLGRADLKGADLGRAYLQRANLWGADLQRANLWGADLKGANLGRADLKEADLGGSDLQGAKLGRADLQGANLRRADLQRADLRRADLKGADLGRADLKGAKLGRADLKGANLGRADLKGADLGRADLQGAKLGRADLKGADLGGAYLQGADLWEADLQGASLGGAVMQGADLGRAHLQRANLGGADLQRANLWGADLQRANLWGADLKGANLWEADLQGADCAGAVFLRAPAQSADLTCAGLTQEHLDGMIGDADTRMPEGLHIRSCWKEAPPRLEETLTVRIRSDWRLEEGDREQLRAEWLCNGATPVLWSNGAQVEIQQP